MTSRTSLRTLTPCRTWLCWCACGAALQRLALRTHLPPRPRFDAKSLKYDPFPKDWIKQQVYASLKAQATSAAAGAAGGRRR